MPRVDRDTSKTRASSKAQSNFVIWLEHSSSSCVAGSEQVSTWPLPCKMGGGTARWLIRQVQILANLEEIPSPVNQVLSRVAHRVTPVVQLLPRVVQRVTRDVQLLPRDVPFLSSAEQILSPAEHRATHEAQRLSPDVPFLPRNGQRFWGMQPRRWGVRQRVVDGR